MIELGEFVKNFDPLAIPIELVKLLEFENEVSKDDFFSEGFELIVDTEKIGLKTYSKNEEFLSSIIEFANADYSGSTYGFWLRDKNLNLSEVPVAAFGSEGGFHIVGENIRELLQIITFDNEPRIDWDEIVYYKDNSSYKPSCYLEAYKNWLYENFNLEFIENPDWIVKKAQDKYQTEFHQWINRYYKEQ